MNWNGIAKKEIKDQTSIFWSDLDSTEFYYRYTVYSLHFYIIIGVLFTVDSTLF